MSYLMKIVEGPNKGAEIALVDGVAVSLGKADSCDIILADPTLPDAPLQIEAAEDGVAIEVPGDGRRHLEPYHVETFGSTSFAIGATDTAWPALVWPKPDAKDEPSDAEPQETQATEAPENAPAEEAKKSDEPAKKRKTGLWVIIAILLLLIILAALGWLFRGKIATMLGHGEQGTAGGAEPTVAKVEKSALDVVVERYGLTKTEDGERIVLAGDFATRAERLAATAQAYAAKPGVELDFADAQSLRIAVEDTFALLGERDLAVTAISNRVVALSGHATNLRALLDAIAADVPKIAKVNCAAVSAAPVSADDGKRSGGKAAKRSDTVDFPVCGILTTPYPCLVMRNGMRILEGASIGENVIVKIEADAVTITNSAGRIVWKP